MNLTKDNYYSQEADKHYFSASQVKSFMSCEAQALAHINGEITTEPTDSMLRGSYLDSMLEGTQEAFEEEYKERLYKKTKPHDLYASFAGIPKIYDFLQKDPFFMDYLEGDKQSIFTGEIAGVPFKAKLDVLNDERIVDLKTTANFGSQWNDSTKKYENFAEFWRYDIQGAIYQELVYQTTGKRLPFYLAVVTTENVPDHEILHIPQNELYEALEEVEESVPALALIKSGQGAPKHCGVCDYCKLRKKLINTRYWREI
jgi:hypothetical protein